MPLSICQTWSGRDPFTAVSEAGGMIGSVMQTGAYWIILWAVMTTPPMAMVSALRETSVLFAAVISTFLLHEGFGVWRFISAGLVTLGLIATRTGGE